MTRVAMVNRTGGGFSGGYRKYLAKLPPMLRAHSDVEDLMVLAPVHGLPTLGAAADGVFGWDSSHELRATLRGFRPDVLFVPTARYVSIPGVPTVCMVRNMEPLAVPFANNLSLIHI